MQVPRCPAQSEVSTMQVVTIELLAEIRLVYNYAQTLSTIFFAILNLASNTNIAEAVATPPA